jgi:hypothetical protein
MSMDAALLVSLNERAIIGESPGSQPDDSRSYSASKRFCPMMVSDKLLFLIHGSDNMI